MRELNNVNPTELIEETAKELSKVDGMKAPRWALYVKTGVHTERPPEREDWWYVRSAAILRSINELGPIGVSKLRTKYGGRKNMGVATDKVFKGSGKVIRTILQQLETSGYVKQAEKGMHKGRIITPSGVSLLSKAASLIPEKKPEEEAPVEKPAPKPAEKAPKKEKAPKAPAPEPEPASE